MNSFGKNFVVRFFMRTLLTYLLLLIFYVPLGAQSILQGVRKDCPDCKIDCMCGIHLAGSDSNKLKIIKDNWNDFFGEDLSALFQMPEGANIVTMKFDGLGCIYPENNNDLINIRKDFLNQKSNKDIYSHTFYNLFNKQHLGKSNDIIKRFISNEGFTVPFDTDGKNLEYFDFINKWNQKHLTPKIEEINRKITSEIKKIIFFIHGYNVPYSLACLQDKIMLNSILESDTSLRPSNILFIAVFWPSGNRKKNIFTPDYCDYSNRENPKTVIAFTYYSNRAYLSGIFIRRVIREMQCKIPIEIITHSHGSTVATTALINTTSKLQRKSFWHRGEFSDSLDSMMRREPLPSKTVNVFLNAPSIPGVATFMDIDSGSAQVDYRFFVGFNERDLVLRKQKFKIWKIKIPQISPTAYLSSTTLGCNKENEIGKTVKVLRGLHMDYIFTARINSNQEEHDFSCYIMQPEFKNNLHLFLLGMFR